MVTRRQTRWIAAFVFVALALSFTRHWHAKQKHAEEQHLPSYETIKEDAGLAEHKTAGVSTPPTFKDGLAQSSDESSSSDENDKSFTSSKDTNAETSDSDKPLISVSAPTLPLMDVAALKTIQNSDLIENAHRAPSADDFISHFKHLVELPNLSIRAAKSTCTWKEAQNVNFQYGNESDWVRADRSNDEMVERRTSWHQKLMNEMVPYSQVKDRFKGRGFVVLVGNGHDTLLRLKVLINMIKTFKTNLPIELHYFEDEMTAENQTVISQWYDKTIYNDLASKDNIMPTKKGILANYHLKSAALVNSRFAEPFFLDSDNIPVISPLELYESDTYKEYGSIFWPDIARSRPQNPMWSITNTPCKMDEYEQESGQLLVDKRKFWYHLQLAAWFNHDDYYNEFLLGDKDMFRFAWHALKTKYGRPKKWLTSVGVVQENDFYCGHSFAQHHPDNGSIAFLHGGLLKTMHASVLERVHQRGRLFSSYKRSKNDEDWSKIERVTITWDDTPWLDKKPPLGPSCTIMDNIQPRDLDEILPGFEEIYTKAGGFEVLEKWQKGDEAKARNWKSYDEFPVSFSEDPDQIEVFEEPDG
ncbi:MAG: hypothetical protein M1828_001771 [Chrysothrix sp. TS-e1954]|nr:MAG: hypothetical protein M1828_001771 [Chrysothrix sp. TS-e1954]